MTNLSRGARQCLNILRTFGGSIFPKQETLAKRLDCGLRTVNRYIAELRKAKILEVEQRGPTSSRYSLHLERLTEQNGAPSSYAILSAETVENPVEKNENGVAFGVAFGVASASGLITECIEVNLEQSIDAPAARATDEQVEDEALRRHLAGTGFEHLHEQLKADAIEAGVGLFVIAARIERAWRVVERKPQHRPKTEGWIWRVSGLARPASKRKRRNLPTCAISQTEQNTYQPLPPAPVGMDSIPEPAVAFPETLRKPPQAEGWPDGFTADLDRLARAKTAWRSG